jgi:hypothetical protein
MSSLKFRSNNTSAPLHTVPVSDISFSELITADFQNYGSQPFIQVNGGGGQFYCIIRGQDSSGLFSANGPVVKLTNGATATIYVRESTNFSIMNNIFADDGTGGTINIYREELRVGGYAGNHSGIVAATLNVYNTSEDRVSQLAYNTIENNGTPVIKRNTINFTGTGISISDIGGKTTVNLSSLPLWMTHRCGFPISVIPGTRRVEGIISAGGGRLISWDTSGNPIFAYSTDYGVNWQYNALSGEYSRPITVSIGGVTRVVSLNRFDYKSYYTDDGGATWNVGGTIPLTPDPHPVTTWIGGIQRILCFDSNGGASAYSDDNGITWQFGPPLPTTHHVTPIVTTVSGVERVVIVYGPLATSYYSTDGGMTWITGGNLPMVLTHPNIPITKVIVNGTNRIVLIDVASVAAIYSDDGGVTWNLGGTIPTYSYGHVPVVTYNNVIYAGFDNAIFYSTDGGITWQLHGISPTVFSSFYISGMHVFNNSLGEYLVAFIQFSTVWSGGLGMAYPIVSQ